VPAELRLPIVTLADVMAFMRRRIQIVLLTCLMAWGLAILYLLVATPSFTADATLVIELKAPLGDAASVSTIVESQIGIISSESVARAVIRKLDLLEDPEFVGRNGVLRRTLHSIGRMLGWYKADTESSVMQRAVDSFHRKLSVKRVGLTYIVGTSFQSTDPERAAQILNTVAETYVAQQMDAKYNSTLRDETWIKGRLNELSSQASAAQKALEDYYKNRNNAANSTNSLNQLLAAAESSASTYDDFRHTLRRMEATRQQSLPVFEARLVTEASPPSRASSPRTGIVFGVLTIAGLLLGVGIGILRDLSGQVSCTGGQLCQELQLPCLAVVPMVGSDDIRGKMTTFFSSLVRKPPLKLASLKPPIASLPVRSAAGERISKDALPNPVSTERPRSRSVVRTNSPIWTVIDAPQSPFTDSILEIKLAIDTMSRNGKRNQVIGITSTQANEGKSTIAAALAVLVAHTGARTILLDCSLRNRSLSAALAPDAAGGLLDIATGAVSLSATTWSDSSSQLAFLPAGNSSRPIYASDILASQRLDKLFQALRESYEYVIVDLPAVTPFADVRAAAPLMDSLILVAEWGRTNIGTVERAINRCSDIDEIMLGVALNKAEPRC
jgi:capsular exopolysaccharide synthesis family protein